MNVSEFISFSDFHFHRHKELNDTLDKQGKRIALKKN